MMRHNPAIPWCLQEERGTVWGPWVDTSSRSPRNTPSTTDPILDSGNLGTVKFPLRRNEERKETKSKAEVVH